MLPFLKKAKESGSAPSSVVTRKPDDSGEVDSMHVAAEEMLSAIENKDAGALASALRAAFELADSEPHSEGPHE